MTIPVPERATLRAEARGAPARSHGWLWPVVLLVGSALVRLPNLDAPLLERHAFRQTQTAITIQAYLDRGFTLLHYETPVFGPPWKAPYEFPTFQASVYPFAKDDVPLDLACRITALLWLAGDPAAARDACGLNDRSRFPNRGRDPQ